MNRQSLRVTLLEQERFTMSSDWIDQIELQRSRGAKFSVMANKYGDDPMSGRRRWFNLETTAGIEEPMALMKAVDAAASLLDVTLEWVDAIPLIATIDWVSAAVIAGKLEIAIPELPATDFLISQRSLRALGKVTVSAEWGGELHNLSMSFERWVRILNGQSFSFRSPYSYEGQRFRGLWSFGDDLELEVTYTGSGVALTGSLHDLSKHEGPKLDGVDLAVLALRAASAKQTAIGMEA